jgi:hypothetical protein
MAEVSENASRGTCTLAATYGTNPAAFIREIV